MYKEHENNAHCDVKMPSTDVIYIYTHILQVLWHAIWNSVKV